MSQFDHHLQRGERGSPLVITKEDMRLATHSTTARGGGEGGGTALCLNEMSQAATARLSVSTTVCLSTHRLPSHLDETFSLAETSRTSAPRVRGRRVGRQGGGKDREGSAANGGTSKIKDQPKGSSSIYLPLAPPDDPKPVDPDNPDVCETAAV